MANTNWLPYRIHSDPTLRISFRNYMQSVDLNNIWYIRKRSWLLGLIDTLQLEIAIYCQ